MSLPRRIATIAAISFFAGASAWWFSGLSTGQFNREHDVRIGGPFQLVDKDGRAVSDRDYRGHYTLVFFGFTGCPSVCPTTLQTIALMMRELDTMADNLRPIFISIDPDRDTPAILQRYVESFDPRIVALTGSHEQIARAARAYRAHYRISFGSDGGVKIEHTTGLYLMDPEGRFIADIAHDLAPRAMAGLIRGLMSRSASGVEAQRCPNRSTDGNPCASTAPRARRLAPGDTVNTAETTMPRLPGLL